MNWVRARSASAGASLLLAICVPAPAEAQRAEENVVTAAANAFGKSVGDETIGLYGAADVRGFSALEAGNARIEGLYFDQQGALIDALERSTTIQVGLSALGYPLPAPTGIVDYELRRVGDKPVVSVRAGLSDYFGPHLSIDAALPVTGSLGLNLGAGVDRIEYVSGAYMESLRYGAIVRHRPAADIELTGFFGRQDYREIQSPNYFTAGAYLPPRIKRVDYYGQPWSDRNGHAQNGGGIAKATLGPWRFEAGLFHSRFTFDRYAADLLRDIKPDGQGVRSTVRGRDQRETSVSGELRASRSLNEGDRLHRAIVSLRARRVESLYGGVGAAELGVSRIGVYDPRPEPIYTFGSLTRDNVRQKSLALAYELRWRRVGELNLGLTRSRYNKVVAEPGRPEARQSDSPWLVNAAVAITATTRLALYASTTRGLEESGLAPNNAANRLQALPALRTRQVEAGFRYALPGNLRLVAGVFDVRKPYFAIDETDNVFRVLGDVRHRGIEASLSGQPISGLTIVAGAVFLDPQVTGAAVEDGRLGRRPLGRTDTVLDIRFDYRPSNTSPLSIDFGILYNGDRIARADNKLVIPQRTTFDLGGRYRFRIHGAAATLRVQVRNLTNVFGWRVLNGGAFATADARRIVASVTTDF